MALGFSQRLLSVLQLTRMALVFTAIADSVSSLLIWVSWRVGDDGNPAEFISWRRVVAVIVVSVGLYGFGMSLNDIIDRRRDRHIAAHRPLPSGRIGIFTAHFVCVLLGVAALVAGIAIARYPNTGRFSLVLLVWTGLLITFYDFAGKYLVAPGLLTLGLIRFFHATIPAPQLPLVWHPLLLLNHIAILSTVAYAWEQKRPSLTRAHWWAVLGGLGLVDVFCVMTLWWRREARSPGAAFADIFWVTPGLLYPAAAVVGFLITAYVIRKKSSDIRAAGRNLMLAGLLWLIVYDASFVAGYVSFLSAGAILLLLPIAYLAVMMMRWWATLMLLSQTPEYQRAR